MKTESNVSNRGRQGGRPCARTGRRDFLRVLTGGAVAMMSLPRGAFAATTAKAVRKPNMILLLSDDHGILDSGCYGSKVVRTPNIDRLAGEGMRFRRAFTGTAMCTPSRSMLYTGLFPHRNGAHRNHSAIRAGVKTLPQYVSELGYRVALAGKKHIKPIKSFPFEFLKLNELGEYLREVGTEPFCLVIATHDPHGPYKKLPPGKGYDPSGVNIPPYLVDTPETRQIIADYYNSVADLDRQVGVYLDLLRKRGLEENTLFIYASDNGTGFPFAKWTLYDAGLNLPFIARWPGRIKPGVVTDAMISFVDVLPTFMEVAGGTAPKTLDGRSFLSVVEGKKIAHRDLIFGTHTTRGIISGSEFPIRCVRTKTHKYIRNLKPSGTFTNILTHGRSKKKGGAAAFWKSWLRLADRDSFAAERVKLYQHRPAEELYDLRTDPFELKNIAGDPSQKELLATLRDELKKWMKQQGDPLLPEIERLRSYFSVCEIPDVRTPDVKFRTQRSENG